MSPARAMPTVETVPEAHDADQGPNGEQQQQQQEHLRLEEDHHPGPEDTTAARENSSWLPSIKDDLLLRRHQTGSPQLHPLLKPRPRSRDRRRSSGIPVARADTQRRASADFIWHGFEDNHHAGSGASVLDPRTSLPASRKPAREQKRGRLSPQSGLSGLPLPAAKLGAREVLRGDEPTPKRTPSAGMVPESQASTTVEHDAAAELGKPSIPDFLDRLDEELPTAAVDGIEQSMAEAASWGGATTNDGKASPSAQSSSSSSTSGSPYSDLSSERTTDTERSSSPERSVDGDETPVAPVLNFVESSLHAAATTTKRRSSLFDVDRYGTPEMPRGTANLPHIPVSVLTPRVPTQSHPKHLPRAEKLPLSGYELLASRISASSPADPMPPRSHPGSSASSSSTATPREHIPRRHSSASNISYRGSSLLEAEPTIQPIYRRFKAMNHRLLLHLQDELSELEEQLHRLDTADTQTRRLQNRILPASRRAEAQAGGELQSHKADILAKIGLKLAQYNHAMTSFTATRDIPSPSPSDVNEYRRYLATHQPVTEIEARFLDSNDDLVTLAPPTTTTSTTSSSSPAPTRTPSPLSSGAIAAVAAAANRDQHYYQALKSTLDASAAATATNEPAAAAPTSTAPTPAPSSAPTTTLPEEPPASPIPIPGTMHGNSWRTNRGHLRGSSSVSHSASPGLMIGLGLSSTGLGPGSAGLPTPQRGSRPRSSSEAFTPRVFTPRSGTPPVVGMGRAAAADAGPAPTAAAAGAASVPTIKVEQPASSSNNNNISSTKGQGEETGAQHASSVVLHVAIALAVAVLLPILAFPSIPGIIGRLIVVFLVGMSVAGSVVQSGSVVRPASSAASGYSRDLFVSVAVYTGVMGVVAGVF